jgi:hypothetical protein
MVQQPRFEQESIALNVVAAHYRDLCHPTVSANSTDVHDEVNRQSDRFADTPVRQTHVRG